MSEPSWPPRSRRYGRPNRPATLRALLITAAAVWGLVGALVSCGPAPEQPAGADRVDVEQGNGDQGGIDQDDGERLDPRIDQCAAADLPDEAIDYASFCQVTGVEQVG